ncbi:MAG: MOSC domain-containing protein [Bdellovibrionia bacterium]
MTEIGRVFLIRRYPFKGMKGEDLGEVLVRTSGLTGDRIYAFVDPHSTSNFPWVTSRLKTDMLLYQPRLKQPPPADVKYPAASAFDLEVQAPDGSVFHSNDPGFAREFEQRLGLPVALRFSEGGQHDSRPISILGLSSIERLEQEVNQTLDRNRFRANFYVKWSDPSPFFEETLVGKTIQLGDKVRVHVVKRNKRCVVITLDPMTTQATPEILKHVGVKYKGLFGVYGVVVDDGAVKNGDAVSLV